MMTLISYDISEYLYQDEANARRHQVIGLEYLLLGKLPLFLVICYVILGILN